MRRLNFDTPNEQQPQQEQEPTKTTKEASGFRSVSPIYAEKRKDRGKDETPVKEDGGENSNLAKKRSFRTPSPVFRRKDKRKEEEEQEEGDEEVGVNNNNNNNSKSGPKSSPVFRRREKKKEEESQEEVKEVEEVEKPKSDSKKKKTPPSQLPNSSPKQKNVLVLPDGSKYVGDLTATSDNKLVPHGIGTLSCGYKMYEGEFVNGKMEGRGRTKYQNNNFHSGQYKDGKRNGFGTFILESGRYEGEFENGLMKGKGKMTWTDGSTFDGEWVENRMKRGIKVDVKEKTKYNGSFDEKGRASGFGEMFYKDGSSHRGFFIKGIPNGKGTFMKHGVTQSGFYKNGKPVGPAMITYSPHCVLLLKEYSTGIGLLQGQSVLEANKFTHVSHYSYTSEDILQRLGGFSRYSDLSQLPLFRFGSLSVPRNVPCGNLLYSSIFCEEENDFGVTELICSHTNMKSTTVIYFHPQVGLENFQNDAARQSWHETMLGAFSQLQRQIPNDPLRFTGVVIRARQNEGDFIILGRGFTREKDKVAYYTFRNASGELALVKIDGFGAEREIVQ